MLKCRNSKFSVIFGKNARISTDFLLICAPFSVIFCSLQIAYVAYVAHIDIVNLILSPKNEHSHKKNLKKSRKYPISPKIRKIC